MDLTTFEEKRRKFLPKMPRAFGRPTVYLKGYPTEDGEPMSATEFHGRQISILSEQLNDYFSRGDTLAYVGTDSFVYYQEGEVRKFVAPDVFVVLGVSSEPLRRSFYTWAEGAAPAVVFEFLSDSTAKEDRGEKMRRYFSEIGIHEYFIHQPEGERPPEFHGWRRRGDGYEAIPPDERGALYSEALNLLFSTEDLPNKLRFMRPYLPDGTPLVTLTESKAETAAARAEAAEATMRVEAAESRVAQAQADARSKKPLNRAAQAQADADAARAEAAEAKMRVEVAESRAAQAQAEADAAREVAESRAAQVQAEADAARAEAAEAKMLAATHARIISELQADMVRLREAVERQHPSEN